jgi:hypothetical protein
MTKRARIFFLTIGFLYLLGYGGFYLKYYFSIREVNKKGLEMACSENKEQEFVGRIININTFDYDNFMHGRFFNLQIRINDSTKECIDYHYNLKPNKEILDFARVGQKATKIKGKDTFILTDSVDNQRSFKIAKCARVE